MGQPTTPAGIKMVPFVNPADPVGSSIDAQQIARQQELADALRQRSIEPIQVQSGNISWTQGLAQLAQVLAANHLQRQANASQWDAGARAQNARSQMHYGANAPQIDMSANPYNASEAGRNFGQRIKDFVSGGPPVGQPNHIAALATAISPNAGNGPLVTPSVSALSAGPTRTPPPSPPSFPQTGQAPAPVSGANGSNVLAPSSPPMPVASNAGTNAPPPAPSPTAPPPPANQALAAPRDQLFPTMTADQGMYSELNAPDEYWKGVISANQPTDVVKNLIAQGFKPGSPEFDAALNNVNRKAGFIDPTVIRGGSSAFMNDGSNRTVYAPNVPEGYQPARDAQGNVTGIVPIAGGPGAVRGSAAAKSIGAADGDLVPIGNDAQGRAIYGRKSDYLQPPTNSGSPPSNGPMPGAGKGSGSLQNTYGPNPNASASGAATTPNGPATTISPAQRGAQEQAGRISADTYNRIISAGEGKSESEQALQMIKELGSTTNTGPGAGWAAAIEGGVNRVARGAGFNNVFDDKHVAKIQEITKLVSSLGLLSGGTGKNGATDARLKTALDALPDPEKAPQALQTIAPYLAARAASDRSQSRAAANYYQTFGADTAPKFQVDWNRNNDPRIFQWMQEGPNGVKAHMNQLSPSERNVVAGKYQALKKMGAF